ncbi:hypothetical protein LGR54_24625 [Ancylobacter sp. Lp-2]|uniref:hypothetical protein n=1 Tax=Ancylobacter sp. Lp-2 TaxID=2881339 RepID=UPI001E527353|nr:hypothetical protein [Ancylobacter sp. Lp-2]MCB4771801.1 hypothetical protein [Ancylobacter sp. Lp-2]
MRRTVPHAVRGVERATAKAGNASLIRTAVNGRSEMLPDDPHEVVKILAERRKKSPALALKTRLLADLRKRGHG